MGKSVLIIGAGVIGLSTAYYCVSRGMTVAVIDRQPAQREGCSFANAGIIVPSHFVPLAAPGMIKLGLKWMWNPASPFYIKPRLDADLFGWAIKFWRASNARQVQRAAPLLCELSLASRKCFEQLAAQPDMDFGLVKRGSLMLCKEQHALEDEAKTADQARALGIPAEVLDPGQVAALDPGARMDIAGGVHFPLDCHLTPARFMAALQRQCEQAGVTFIWNREAVDWHVENRRIRALKASSGEEIPGDEFVLCGGSWSPLLAGRLGLNIPIQAGKGYSLTLSKPRQLPQICSILVEARVAVTPMGDALRVGGTMEIAGLNEDVNPIRIRGIVDSFCHYFPEFSREDFDGIQPMRGLRPCSPDGLPYVGRTKKFENLSLAAGHAMIGLSLGPITGKLMAEILSKEKPETDIAMLSPDRYG
jgi:D-amino-acid dehydrogenase